MSNSKALTNGEWKDTLLMVVEGISSLEKMNPDAIRSHLNNKGLSHRALELMLGMDPQQAIDRLMANSTGFPDYTLRSEADRNISETDI